MVSANLVPRYPRARGKGISSCMYILEVFFFYDNDNDYNSLQSDDFFGF